MWIKTKTQKPNLSQKRKEFHYCKTCIRKMALISQTICHMSPNESTASQCGNLNFFLALLFTPEHYAPEISVYEVKAWLCWNLIIVPSLQFYVKYSFGEFKRSKNVIFGNFGDSELLILVNLGLESCSNLLKSKFRTFKIAKKDIFGPFEFAKT